MVAYGKANQSFLFLALLGADLLCRLWTNPHLNSLPTIGTPIAAAKTEESAILLLARNGHHQNLLVIWPKSTISSLLYI